MAIGRRRQIVQIVRERSVDNLDNPRIIRHDLRTSARTVSEPILFSDWLEESGCAKSTAYELLKLGRIEPDKVRVPGSRRPMSQLSAEQREQLEWLWNQRRAGASREELERQVALAHGEDPEQSADDPGSSTNDPGTTPDNPALALSERQQGAVTELVASITTRAISVALANAKPPRPAVDPLKRAKLLAEAAGLDWLSAPEVATVLGTTQKALDGLQWPHTPRPGYRVERDEIDGQTWFRVLRSGGSSGSGMSSANPGGGGFFGMGRELAACHAIVPATVVELPRLC